MNRRGKDRYVLRYSYVNIVLVIYNFIWLNRGKNNRGSKFRWETRFWVASLRGAVHLNSVLLCGFMLWIGTDGSGIDKIDSRWINNHKAKKRKAIKMRLRSGTNITKSKKVNAVKVCMIPDTIDESTPVNRNPEDKNPSGKKVHWFDEDSDIVYVSALLTMFSLKN